MGVQHQVAYTIDLGQKSVSKQKLGAFRYSIFFSLNELIFASSHFFKEKKVGKKETFFTRKLLYFIIMLPEWIAV